jgi:hypothetical protein
VAVLFLCKRLDLILPTGAYQLFFYSHLIFNTYCFSREKNFGLTIAKDNSGKAIGDLFWDDGESIDTIGLGLYHYGVFTFENVGF